MIGNKSIKKLDTTNGDLRTPITFYSNTIADGLDGRDIHYKPLFDTFGEVYNPSLKDLEITASHGVKASFTIKVRDAFQAYNPSNSHFVEIKDSRFRGKKWPIVSIRPDFHQRDFLIIVLGGAADE